jgi:hypothetical protein
MNATSPHIRETEMNGSVLESFGGQKESTETFVKARELRRWIAAHPGSKSIDMPAELQRYLGFLLRKRLVTWVGYRDRRYTVRAL